MVTHWMSIFYSYETLYLSRIIYDLAVCLDWHQSTKCTVTMGDLRLSGSIIRKSRFIFTKERRNIRQKSGCLNHSNERIFQVNILMQGRIKASWKGGTYA